ncbi:hypothetical protein GBA52_006555 [Prunus armeniaca]|nr:hypothetical protein GBA52_006555 [Prunus armeniaca]
MGKKAKTSRKGKKAWRANISTEDIHDFFEQSTKDALSGGSLSSAPAESLFFVDKSKDLSVKRKIEKHRQKVLHVESMLQKNPFVQAVPSSTLKKSKKTFKEVPKPKDATECGPQGSVSTSGMADLWGDKGFFNLNNQIFTAKPSLIPAVEVEPPGSSFNPTFESHQETLAHAVAQEMHKVYKKELGPQPVPLTVPGEAVDEEEMYFLDADEATDDDMNPENLDENEDAASEKRPLKTKRVTTVMLNKRARRKEQLKKEAEAKKAQKLSKEIDGLPDILQEIAKEDDEKHKRHIRRVVAKKEKLKSCPPRLGKHKFEPAPVQVLLTEEITGSLRKLKGCCTLVKDRFKSLEKRGLIPPKLNKRCVEPKSLAGVQRGSATDAASDFVNVNGFRPFLSPPSPRPALLLNFAAASIDGKISVISLHYAHVSSQAHHYELSLEQDAERKIGWLLKLIFAGTATCIAYNIMPYMGDNLLQQSVSLLTVKDPLFKRMGASRLAQFAIDDERRMKIVEMGGAQELVNMLVDAKDDRTRKEALKALSALSPSDQAIGALHQAGAISVIRSTPDSLESAEIEKYKSGLLKRFQDLRYDIPSTNVSRSSDS